VPVPHVLQPARHLRLLLRPSHHPQALRLLWVSGWATPGNLLATCLGCMQLAVS
jgi:hypothetical protein